LPNSSLTSRAASSPHGYPGPGTPPANARATRARSARPATVTLSRISGPAISAPAFLGRKTQLTYIVREFIPGERIRLRGENKTVIAVDTMTFRSIDAGTEVTYTAEFTFKGPTRLLAPLLRPAFERLGQQAQAGMRTALNQL
jgi:hypothetical protein